ncbi:MAG: chain length determinant protein EpsF [Burkholderiaceae bacterium]|nr:chain length determinant protein EpsF [Burkholderiaceae bacterium]
MTFAQFLSILQARKWVALAVFSLVVATAVAVSLLLPKQYTAVASILMDAKPDPVSAMAYSRTAGFMATQGDILTSKRVALRVIRDLKLLDNSQLREQWLQASGGAGTIEQWLVKLLQKGLGITPSRDSQIIQIEYESPDPRFAAVLANAFAQAYIATTLELRVDPAKQFKSFFDAQSKEAREALEKAQARLSSFQRENGIIATDERLDIENARLNQLSSQLVQIQAISSESGSRQAQAEGTSGERMQEVINNSLIVGMKADVNRQEARLQELNSKFGDRHPQVIEANASIAELHSRIDAEIRRVTGGVAVTNTINKEREATVRRELDLQRAKMLRLKAVRDEGQVLVREVENAQRAYDALMARLTQTALESLATQTYASTLTSAEAPTEHSSPKLVTNTALAVFLGALLAVGVTILVELTNRRVRCPEDVLASLGIPVLGSLPKPSAKRFSSGKRISLTQQRVIGLPAPSGGA